MRTGGDFEPRGDASVDVAVSQFRMGGRFSRNAGVPSLASSGRKISGELMLVRSIRVHTSVSLVWNR